MDQQTILQLLYCHENKLDSHCVIPVAAPGAAFDYVREEPVVILLAVLPPDLFPVFKPLLASDIILICSSVNGFLE